MSQTRDMSEWPGDKHVSAVDAVSGITAREKTFRTQSCRTSWLQGCSMSVRFPHATFTGDMA